jgi:hypothetical protein
MFLPSPINRNAVLYSQQALLQRHAPLPLNRTPPVKIHVGARQRGAEGAGLDRRVMESQRDLREALESLEDRVAPLLTNPTLDNFDGFLTVRLLDGGGERPRTRLDKPEEEYTWPCKARQPCRLVVQFTKVPAGGAAVWENRIFITAGNDTPHVTFDVVVESDDIGGFPKRDSITFNSKFPSPSMGFEFETPEEVGTHDIFVEVVQSNRLIQVVRTSVTISATAE